VQREVDLSIRSQGLATDADHALQELASERGRMAACHLDAPRELSRNLRSQVDDNAEFFGERWVKEGPCCIPVSTR